jgi:hypothetical protein
MAKIGTQFRVAAIWFAWTGVASAHSIPIWQEYKALLCQAQNGQICDPDLGQCTNVDGKWIMRFNFEKNEISTLGSTKIDTLGARYSCSLTPQQGDGPAMAEAMRYYCDASGLGSVYHNGNLYSFTNIVRGTPGISDTVYGVEQSSGRDHIYAIRFACHPE